MGANHACHMNSTSLIKVQNAEHAIELETSKNLSVGAARAFSLILCEYDEHIANLQGIYSTAYLLCSFSASVDSMEMRCKSMAASFGCATKGVSM